MTAPLYESQLAELCGALGWQGGTYHQVLREVKRLKRVAEFCDACVAPNTVIAPVMLEPGESDSEGGEA